MWDDLGEMTAEVDPALSSGQAVPPSAWLAPRQQTDEVYESTFAIPTLSQVLSLIWVVESE